MNIIACAGMLIGPFLSIGVASAAVLPLVISAKTEAAQHFF
jgi:hypothetical protein